MEKAHDEDTAARGPSRTQVVFGIFALLGVGCGQSESNPARGGGDGGKLGSAGAGVTSGQPGTGGSSGSPAAGGGASTGGNSGHPAGGAGTGGAVTTAGVAGTAGGNVSASGGAGAGGANGGRGGASAGAAGVGGESGAGSGGMAASAGMGGSTTSGPCTKEDCWSGCTVGALPAFSALSANSKLPDPFMKLSGARIGAKSDWECRRAELGAQLQNYETGQKNPKDPGSVTGSVSGNKLTVSVLGKSFSVGLTLPSGGAAPYPAIIYLDTFSLPGDFSAVAKIQFDTNAMGDQNGHRGQGFFFSATGSSDGAGALIAWAWGVSRILDALEATPDAKIDPKRVAITGCSRNGKGALMIGAFDERIALTIPQESGSGGMAAWRISYAEDASFGGTLTNHQVQTLDSAYGEQPWFGTALQQFGTTDAVNKLPFDHHELAGMVAPRPLLVLENTDYEWLGVNSIVNDATAAQLIFQGLGVADNMGFANSGHSHCVANDAEAAYVDAFVQKFLLGQSDTATKVWKVSKPAFGSSTLMVDKTKWIDWTVPALN
jgi:hypothetical protein